MLFHSNGASIDNNGACQSHIQHLDVRTLGMSYRFVFPFTYAIRMLNTLYSRFSGAVRVRGKGDSVDPTFLFVVKGVYDTGVLGVRVEWGKEQ